jgi:hypothetical protein
MDVGARYCDTPGPKQGNKMIRQAISCDICGAEKRQTNHWFVAYTQAGELRVAGWKTNGRMRTGAKHLCGQVCLHKLMDEFIAGTMSNRAASNTEAPERAESMATTDASLTSSTVYGNSAPAGTVANAVARPLAAIPTPVIAISPSRVLDEPRPSAMATAVDDAPDYGSRRRRAEAWERERERCSSLSAHRKTL